MTREELLQLTGIDSNEFVIQKTVKYRADGSVMQVRDGKQRYSLEAVLKRVTLRDSDDFEDGVLDLSMRGYAYTLKREEGGNEIHMTFVNNGITVVDEYEPKNPEEDSVIGVVADFEVVDLGWGFQIVDKSTIDGKPYDQHANGRMTHELSPADAPVEFGLPTLFHGVGSHIKDPVYSFDLSRKADCYIPELNGRYAYYTKTVFTTNEEKIQKTVVLRKSKESLHVEFFNTPLEHQPNKRKFMSSKDY